MTGSRGRRAGRRSSTSPSRRSRPAAPARRARTSRCRAGSRRARSSPRATRQVGRQPGVRRAPRRGARACGCAPTARRSARAGAPGSRPGGPKPSSPAARQSTAWSVDERVDQLLAHPRRSVRGRARRAALAGHDVAGDPLHHVERRADHGGSSHTASTRGTGARPASARCTRASRSTSCALGGSGPRGGRRRTSRASPRVTA